MKLFMVHLGFYDSTFGHGMYENHTNLLVVAEDAKAAKQKVKQNKTFIDKRMHVDAIFEISHVDGFDVKLERNQCVSTENMTFNYDAVKALDI